MTRLADRDRRRRPVGGGARPQPGTQDVFPLSQTPLRFLLSDNVDLMSDTNLVAVYADDGLRHRRGRGEERRWSAPAG